MYIYMYIRTPVNIYFLYAFVIEKIKVLYSSRLFYLWIYVENHKLHTKATISVCYLIYLFVKSKHASNHIS